MPFPIYRWPSGQIRSVWRSTTAQEWKREWGCNDVARWSKNYEASARYVRHMSEKLAIGHMDLI